MGLDTRAFRRATGAWKAHWATEINEAGERPSFFGLVVEPLTRPVTADDAPDWHQDDLEDLPWPGGLVGGMLSRGGDGPSFRGKVYTEYVEAVTGHSLYEPCEGDFWEGELLREITDALEMAWLHGAPDETHGDITDEEREALAKWFRVCVDNDLGVSGDY